MARVIKDEPLAELTLRKYEKPYQLERRDLFRKICLSLGLLQPGDSRDIVVDVLQVIVDSGKELTSDDIVSLALTNRKTHGLSELGGAASNIRRQIKRLRDVFLVEKVANNYRVAENAKLVDIFTEKIEKFYLRTLTERIKEYLSLADEKSQN